MRNPTRWLVACLLVLGATRAEAFPSFARKYGMSCTACHVAWPIFNQVGQNFWDSGYQFGLGKDDSISQGLSYIPFSLRTTPNYTFTRTTNQASDNGPMETHTGGISQPAVDILTGGTIAQDLSFLVVLTGFSPTDAAFVESAWARASNVLGTSWLNFKVGKFELDQPASAHRNVTLTTGYAVYSAHPAGSSMAAFDLGTNQLGVELSGHDARSTTRYSLAVVSANGDPGSQNAFSSPLVYAHVQRSFELDNRVLPWVRVGALGAVGWWPTSFATLTTGGTTANVPNSGANHKSYQRVGGELSWMLGYPSTPALFTAACMYGREEAGLAGTDPGTGADLSGRSNGFTGGFLELDWVPFAEVTYNSTPWLFYARYDFVRYQTGSGNYDGGTLGVRRYLAIGPKGAMAIHAELHADKTRGAGWVNPDTNLAKDVESQSILVGLDFDF